MVAGSIPVRRSWTSLWEVFFCTILKGDASPSLQPQLPLPPLRALRRRPAKPCKARVSAMLAWLGPSRRGFCNSPASHTNVTLEERSDDRVQNRFICHPERSAKHEVEGSRTDVIPVLYRDHRYFSAFYINVCFEWHFARKHDHFVEVFALRNASSPQRNTRGALLGADTARNV